MPGDSLWPKKIHKDGIPLRSILSTISTHFYLLAKVLVPLFCHISSTFCIL